ncbi:MAG: hypothetical protein C0459_14505 [Chitinophaga sp.]|jgi:hypothetical protein|nr:hypothetical protein [Chitinophaga sp.]
MIFTLPVCLYGQERFLLSDTISRILSNPLNNELAKQNKIQRVIKYNSWGDTTKAKLIFREIFFYNTNGNLDSIYSYVTNRNKNFETKQEVVNNFYDKDYKILKSVVTFSNYRKVGGIATETTNFEYDSDTVTRSMNHFSALDENRITYSNLTYNKYHLIKRGVNYTGLNKIERIIEYEYYDNNLPKSVTWKDSTGKIQGQYLYIHKFNKNGRVTKIVSNSVVYETVTEVKYNSQNQCIKIQNSFNQKNYNSSTNYFFSYNLDGTLALCKEEQSNSNFTGKAIKFYKFEYIKYQ